MPKPFYQIKTLNYKDSSPQSKYDWLPRGSDLQNTLVDQTADRDWFARAPKQSLGIFLNSYTGCTLWQMVFLFFLYVIRLRINKMCSLQGLSKLNVLDLQDNQVPLLRPSSSLRLCVCVCGLSLPSPPCSG